MNALDENPSALRMFEFPLRFPGSRQSPSDSSHCTGHLIHKTNNLGDTVFHSDTKGRLVAETLPSGTLKRELLYLGDIPVAVVQ